MSIFVDKDRVYNLNLRWQTEGSKVVILPDLETKPAVPVKTDAATATTTETADVPVKAVVETLPLPDAPVETVTVKFRYPTYADDRAITRAATAPDQNGIPVVNVLSLQNIMLFTLIKEWDLKNDKGEAVPISDTTIGNLHPTIARALVNRLYLEMSASGSAGLF